MTEYFYKIIKPETAVKAMLVCVHGMQEHHARYLSFAKELAKQGVAVLVYDLPGHGEGSKDTCGFFAEENGDEVLLRSVDAMVQKMNAAYPAVPHFLFGHSMGSILVRNYMPKNDDFSGVILSGAPNYQSAAGIGRVLAEFFMKIGGSKGHTPILTELSLGAFSRSVKNAKTPIDWLSYNEENVKEYHDDPLCGNPFTNSGYRDLFVLVQKLHHPFSAVNRTLPIIFLSGKDDPCTGGTKGLHDSINILRKAGYCNIQNVVYENMRHEILNEKGHEIIYREIIQFICNNSSKKKNCLS